MEKAILIPGGQSASDAGTKVKNTSDSGKVSSRNNNDIGVSRVSMTKRQSVKSNYDIGEALSRISMTRRKSNNDQNDIENPNESDDILKTVQKFRKERDDDQNKRFYAVVAQGWGLLLLGVIGFWIDIMVYYSNPYYHDKLSWCSRAVNALCLFLINVGYLVFSTVPLDMLDLDEVVSPSDNTFGNKGGFKWVRYLISVAGAAISMGLACLPPYVFFIDVLICVVLLYPEDKNSLLWNKYPIDRFTFKMAFWYLTFIPLSGVLYAYFAYASINGVDISNQGFFGVQFPIGKAFGAMWTFLSVYIFIASFPYWWYWWSLYLEYYDSNMVRGAPPTLLVYYAIYDFAKIFGSAFTINGIWFFTLAGSNGTSSYDCFGFGFSSIAVGAALLMPPIAVQVIGRDRIFSIMVRKYDNNPDRLKSDGNFIAQLLNKEAGVQVGQEWWIYNNEIVDESKETAHERYFSRGKVTSVDVNGDGEKVFYVEVKNSPIHIGETEIKVGKTDDSEELLENATINLRYVAYDDIVKHKLFTISPRKMKNDDDEKKRIYALSKKIDTLPPGRKIDFFVSHSWSDDGDLKLSKLEEFAAKFKKDKGYSPTFWLDTACIDQSNIGNGLKVLPINIMACSQMLVLCGDTYCDRLWCVWYYSISLGQFNLF